MIYTISRCVLTLLFQCNLQVTLKSVQIYNDIFIFYPRSCRDILKAYLMQDCMQ